MTMVEDALHDSCFIIDVVVSNDDSTMRSVINNPHIFDKNDKFSVQWCFKTRADNDTQDKIEGW